MNVVRPPGPAQLTQVREILALLGDDKALTARLAEFTAGVAEFEDEQRHITACREDLRLQTEKVDARRADLEELEAQEQAVQDERARLEANTVVLHRGVTKLREDKAALDEEALHLKLAQSQLGRDLAGVTEDRQRVNAQAQAYEQAVSRMKGIAETLTP